jgi:hypothetical protein
MGMAIYESGHDDAPGRIDVHGSAGLGQVLHPARGADFHHFAVANEERPIVDQAKLAEGRPATRTMGTAQRKQLAGAPNQNCPQFLLP